MKSFQILPYKPGRENEVSRFVICTFTIVFKHVWNYLEAAVYDYW